jgi:hypothetical protein
MAPSGLTATFAAWSIPGPLYRAVHSCARGGVVGHRQVIALIGGWRAFAVAGDEHRAAVRVDRDRARRVVAVARAVVPLNPELRARNGIVRAAARDDVLATCGAWVDASAVLTPSAPAAALAATTAVARLINLGMADLPRFQSFRVAGVQLLYAMVA